MNFLDKLLSLPLWMKLGITLIIFFIGLRFGAILLIFLPFVFFINRKEK